MNATEIAAKLESAGCTVKIWNDCRVYVTATPNGGRRDYGYCVAADDSRDMIAGIKTRSGEIAGYLRA